ncbi:hypothetical protein CEW88_23635 (plasmid) [Alloyangia pacifica]|uniref:AlgX/AlgJ SGNH hydrolase-like domain-containing protein n=2 Tax=Alloyangia pacifica TaxID=311180 RepID=A0A2U8HLJ4_9RHOB|nr:hypothetical protein CEW88_23635 [Alloyangia pacifica]
MAQAIETIRRHIPPGREVWTYGASMGGTGALMFARPLGATGVLALYPQASVDLTRASFDPRWMDDRQRIARYDDSWLDHAPTANTWLLSDPRFSLDQQHIDMITKDHDGIHLVPLDFSEHSCMRMLLECGMLSATIRSIFDGTFELQAFRSAIRRERHRSPVALTGAANALARRGKLLLACRFSNAAVTLLAQAKQAGHSLDPATTVVAMHGHAINLVRARNRDGAANYLRHLRDEPLISADHDWQLLQLAFASGDRQEAARLFSKRQRNGQMTGPWQTAMVGCMKNKFFSPEQLAQLGKTPRKPDMVVGPSHAIRWQWHLRDGVVPGPLPPEKFCGLGGAPVWSRMLFDRATATLGEHGHLALLVPDFRFGNGILLDAEAKSGPLLQDGFLAIAPEALTPEHDRAMLDRSMAALQAWHDRFGNRARYVFWCLFGRQVHDRMAGKHITDGRYQHPVFTYEEIVARLPDLDVVDLAPLLRRPMHDVRRLFIDPSSNPSQIGYLLLSGMLFDGLDALTAYERAVATVEADMVALAKKIRNSAGRPVVLTGRSVWLDILVTLLGATGSRKLADAGLIVMPLDPAPGQPPLEDCLRQHTVESCHPIILAAGGADLSPQLATRFGTKPEFWQSAEVIDWETATETPITARNETPRHRYKPTGSPKASKTAELRLVSSMVEQGPLGMPSWAGIRHVLERIATGAPATKPPAQKVEVSNPVATSGITIEGDALLTEDGVAFLIGGNHSVLKYATGAWRPGPDSLANFERNIASRGKIASAAGARFAHVIFPDKQSVMTEAFPYQPVTRLGDLYTAHLGDRTRPLVLYPADQLHDAPEPAFQKLDTHLTDHGSLAVLRLMLARVDIQAERALTQIEARIMKPQRWSGDLGNKFTPRLFQEGVVLDANWPVTELRSPGGFNNGMIDLLFNPGAEHDGTVLMFGDSFFRMMLKQLSAVFSRVVHLRTPFLHPEIVELVAPDIIFTGNAERYLARVTADSDAHAFSLYTELQGGPNLREDPAFFEAWRAMTSPRSAFAREFLQKLGFTREDCTAPIQPAQ